MQSSGNKLILELQLLGKLLMYIKKRHGPRTVPCGTLATTGDKREEC